LVTLYHSPVCLECHAAREFFAEHGVTVDERDVSDPAVRARMEHDLGRVATPAIVVGKRVFWGFEENKQDIADLLGLAPPAETATRGFAANGSRTDPA
jgi:glutaredoxin 3